MGSGSRGALVSIEGIDAVGKRTQATVLASWLGSRGLNVRTVSFPDYGTVIGSEIRRFLHGGVNYPPEVRHILFAANRWEKKRDLESALTQADVVIVNRYSESNLAYGVANGLKLEWLAGLEDGLPKPDLVVVLDAPAAELRSRRGRRKDEYESDAALQDRTRRAYLDLAAEFGWKVVDATGGIEATSRALRDAVSGSLKAAGRTV
jgi:dTMP kinase